MALSLLQHIHTTQATVLHQAVQEMGLNTAQATTILDWTVPLVLAHLVSLNQRHGTGLVLALVNTQAVNGIWQTLDQDEWISQVQKQLNFDPVVLQLASDHIVNVVLAEILALVDAASLGEEGLNELLDGQTEHLQGQAPDWIWQQAGLTALCGQAAVQPEQTDTMDLAAGIASLNKLVRQAANHANQPISESTMSSIELGQTQHHDAEHPTIHLAPQRDAGCMTRVFEPLIALVLLGFLYALFMCSSARTDLILAPPMPVASTIPSEESILTPIILADESELPPMSHAPANATELQLAIEEAQRTGAQALQFSDNSLSP